MSTLQLLAVGAPLTPELQGRLAARLPSCVIGQGWGLTETSGALTIPDRHAGAAPGTVGTPLAGIRIRVVSPETGDALPPGVDGELEANGPQVMEGYLGRADETAAMLRDGAWLRTGDLGHVDADGNVVIVDRIKDVIKVNAYQVAPTEVEGALTSHPAVTDAAVVGRPDDRRGEVPVAFVVLGDTATSTGDVMAWLQDGSRCTSTPAGIHVVDALPRTPSGKLLRRTLGR